MHKKLLSYVAKTLFKVVVKENQILDIVFLLFHWLLLFNISFLLLLGLIGSSFSRFLR